MEPATVAKQAAALGLAGVSINFPPLMLAGAVIFIVAVIGYISTLWRYKHHKKELAKFKSKRLDSKLKR